MSGAYNLPLVAISIGIAIIASYTALDLARSLAAARGRARSAWLAGGALAMGTGIWSMHFTGMLALRMPGIPIAFDVPLVVLSVVVAIAASALALLVAGRNAVATPPIVGAALAMGAAIAGMHYIGIWAMRMPARIDWSPGLVATSIGIAFGASFVALWLALRHRRDQDGRGGWGRAGGAVVMGLAISGMHYTGMAAARFVPGAAESMTIRQMDVLATPGLAVAVTGATALILLIAITGSAVSRKMARRSSLAETESFRRAARILESITDAFFALDREWRFTYVNKEAERLLGKSRGELLGRNIWEEYREAVGSAFHREYHRALEEQRTAEFQAFYPPLDAWYDVRAFPSEDGLSVYFRDVTERRRAEETLRDREAKLSALLESTTDPIAIKDVEGRILLVNRAGAAVLRKSPEDLIGRRPEELIPPDLAAEVRVDDARVLESGAPHTFENRVPLPEGERVFLVSKSPYRLGDGSVGGVISISRDITERKQTENALRELNEMLQTLIQASPLAIVAIDREGKVMLWNPAAERTFGWTEAEVLGRPMPFVPEEKRKEHQALRERALRGERLVSVEVERRRKSGSLIPISVSAAPLQGADGVLQGVVSFAEDVTERVEARKKLQAYAHELERSNAELQAFAHIASHDLQEPLRKIRAFGDRLQRFHADRLGPEGRDYVDRMIGAAGRGQTLINDLLAYSRVTSKAEPFRAVDLGEVARAVTTDLEVRTRETGGIVEIGALPSVEADPTQMRQLLQNLIGNALKYHHVGVPPVVQVSGGALPSDNLVEIVVEDNGIGFEPEHAERIFDVFQRLHGRDEHEGTGVGLAICKKIVERHGGQIRAEGRPGQGAKFTATLPLRQLRNEEAP